MNSPEPPQNICLIRDGRGIPLDAVYDGIDNGQHVWAITTVIDLQPTDRISIDVLPAHTTIRFPAEPLPAPDPPGLFRSFTRADWGIFTATVVGAVAIAALSGSVWPLVFGRGILATVASVLTGPATGVAGYHLARRLVTVRNHG